MKLTESQKILLNLKEDSKTKSKLQEIIDEVKKLEKSYGYDFEYDYDIDDDENEIIVYIDWGDWKHDHIHVEGLFQKVLDNMGLYYTSDENVTEEDGSDAYSATHVFKIDFDKPNSERPISPSEEYEGGTIKYICRTSNIPYDDKFVKYVMSKDLSAYSAEDLKNLRKEYDNIDKK